MQFTLTIPEFVIDLVILLSPAIKAGCNITFKVENGNFCADLNTEAKSYCVLVCQDGKIMAHRRYNQIDEVKSFKDVLDAVYGCGHGRSFFSQPWLDLLNDYGYESPLGNL